jgi:tetratricopeptide (TPR) repeat protein
MPTIRVNVPADCNSDRPPGNFDAFLSHSSKDKRLATRLERSLEAARLVVWIDRANIRAGGLLLDALQDALSRSANVVVLWSVSAAESRYVSAEWQAAFHLQKGIIPCLVDDTALPPFLMRYLYCDFQGPYKTGLSALVAALQGKPPARPKSISRRPGKLRDQLTRKIVAGQEEILECLGKPVPEVKEAAAFQARLDGALATALQSYAKDAMVLNLAGYHKKNAYMIRHWDAIQAGQAPADPSLAEAEKSFFEALSIRPDDPSALNGLGSVLILRRDLDAAEFFVRRALDRAKDEHLPYAAAEHDLQLIQRLKHQTRGN